VGQSLERHVDAAFRARTPGELLAAPTDALAGVSAADAAALRAAFGITSIAGLAAAPPVRHALAVLAAAGTPGFDPGPPPSWEAFFATAPLDAYIARADQFRIEFGPVLYRGRLDGTARLLVMGQDPSTDELLAGRILVGLSGQRVQGLLRRLGLTRSYSLLNTFLFSVKGQFVGELRTLSRSEPFLGYRNAYLDRLRAENPLEAVLAVGGAAQDAIGRWPGRVGLQVIEVGHPAAPDAATTLAGWNAALGPLGQLVGPDDGQVQDLTPYGTAWTPADHAPIPRADLPFGLPAWHGHGDHSHRDGPTLIVWEAPAP
jgi:uracil-DNA glycosylase